MPPGPPAVRSASAFPNLWQTILLLLLFLGFTACAAILLTPLRGRLSQQAWFLLVVLTGEGVGLLVGFRLARWQLSAVLANLGFSTRTLGWLLVIGTGTLLLIGSLLYALSHVFGPVEPENLMNLFSVTSAVQFFLLFVTVTVVAPTLEELLVRGILLRGLTLNRGARAGVFWSAFFFAVMHVSLLQAPAAFVNGVVWAIVLLRTGSLGATLFLHALNNGLVFLMVQVSLLAIRSAEARGGLEPELPLAAQIWLAALAAMSGAWLIGKGLSRLPRTPERVASLWGVPPALAGSRLR
jgi:membrane protease YdiL (CAAX protease family)